MTSVNVDAKLGEHDAHIMNIRDELTRQSKAIEDVVKSQRKIISRGQVIEQKIDAYLDASSHRDDATIENIIRRNLDRISIWLIIALVLILMFGPEKTATLIGSGILGQ